ncbi:HK97 family phage prohead protease [Mediterraneibacter glycyrrhizinilyticus]
MEIRADGDREKVIIDGYVNVADRDSRPIPDGKGGYFIERIASGTFRRAIAKADEVKILLNHKWDKVLGSTKTNLTLREDVIGLRAHAEIDDPEVVQKAKEKRLRGWSFGFTSPAEERADRNGMQVRTITGLILKEVSLIDDTMRPWYPSTTVETRAGEESEETFEIRAEEFEADYIGFEDKNEPEKPDNSKLKNLIKKYGGNV